MHITFDISKGQRKRLASALGLELNRDGNVCIEATVAEMHKLLLAARLLCLSKVSALPAASSPPAPIPATRVDL